MFHKLFAPLKHLFSPQEENNYKARYLHHDFLTGIIAILLLVNVALRLALPNLPLNVLGVNTDISVEALLNYTNAERLKYNLNPLTLNQKLTSAAAKKATHMFANNYWAHFAPDGTSPWFFFQTVEYNYVYAGENLAKDFASSQAIVQAWMNSEKHRENILKPEYKEIGFAIAEGPLEGEDTILVVQFFGTESTTLAGNAPTENNAPSVQNPAFEKGAKVLGNTPSAAKLATVKTSTEIVKKPLFDIQKMQKEIVIFVLGGLIVALAIDLYFSEKRKTFHLSSKAITHLLFTLLLILSIISTNPGMIL
jgi:hypothetical protein